MPTTQAEKGRRFQALHAGPPFVIPNPWDAGAASVLAALGFPALATTSSGFAFTLGRRDGEVRLDEVIAHTRNVAAATDLPVSVDLENGYDPAPEGVAAAVRAAAAAGAVGGSIEDFDPATGIYELEHAVRRVATAVRAARSLDVPFVLTARAENHVHGRAGLDDTIRRLRAFEAAGADVLFAPGLDRDEVRAVRRATTAPLNALARPDLMVDDLFAAGAQRVSVGGRLTWVAAQAAVDVARSLLRGDSSGLARGDARRVADLLEKGRATPGQSRRGTPPVR